MGKYTEVVDAYKSINEALIHAGIGNCLKVNVLYVDATQLSPESIASKLSSVAGVVVLGGFGSRGFEGKMAAITYARENKIPFGNLLGYAVSGC